MKKIKLDDKSKSNILVYSISGIIIIAGAFVLFNIGSLFSFIKDFINVLSPFIWGIFFAFIMAKFANFLEKKLPNKLSFKTKRLISSILSVILLILILVIIVLIITPQLAESIKKLTSVISKFSASPIEWVKKVEVNSKLPNSIVELLYEYSNTLISSIWTFIKTSVPSIINITVNTVSGLLNFVIGFIVALYMLIDRERIIEAFRRFFKAFTSKKTYVKLTVIYNMSISKFYKFFEGKIIDSLLIGVLCFIIMSILGLDFAMLISVIVAITNVIPFFGPFIGGIPSGLILLMVDPTQAIVFGIMILVLQQIEGNIIEPKILGDSVGLSSLWIMFAILVGGAYFGFFGMLLGVPIFSVIYYLVKEEIDNRLDNNKKIKQK